MNNKSIGVFDSGLGGLTAVKSLMRELPNENIVYFGDTGRLPYGTKTEETIKRYSKSDINFLLSKDVKMVIIACGTASSVALDSLKDEYDIPIIGVVEPASRAAVEATKNGRIGIIGTSATVRSRSYEREIMSLCSGAKIFTAACPLFVPLVENGRCDPDDVVLYTMVEEYLAPIKAEGVDTLIMGCTHYPIIERAIAKYMGEKTALINPGLEAAGYLKQSIGAAQNASGGSCRFFVSDDRDGFSENASKFLGKSLCGEVELKTVGK